MSKLWLTYAWKDNEEADVDFVAGRIRDQGVEVGLDRTRLLAGARLWDQIASQIEAPDLSAWAIYVTENSLRSEPCQEELAYALDRVLRTKGSTFPLIGIFPTKMDRDLVPSSIATRLYVSLRDEDWASRIADSVRGHSTQAIPMATADYFKIHVVGDSYVYEMRPREGTWYPAKVAVRASERSDVRFAPYLGPKATPAWTPPMFNYNESRGNASDGSPFVYFSIYEQLDNSRSLYLRSKSPFTAIGFGGGDKLELRLL